MRMRTIAVACLGCCDVSMPSLHGTRHGYSHCIILWLLQALLSAFVFGFHVHEKAILTVGLINLLFRHIH